MFKSMISTLEHVQAITLSLENISKKQCLDYRVIPLTDWAHNAHS